MTLAIFDLDNTLIADDSDYLWGQFLVDHGIVDRSYYEQTNAKFYEDYKNGNLDIVEFLNFSLKPLSEHPSEQLFQWRQQFVQDIIKPLLLPAAQQLVQHHQQMGHTTLVITATNRFVTEPIVALYGIEHLLATTPEIINGRYTGAFIGTPCFQRGKITYLQQWLENTNEDLSDSWFYSDSHNDLPLLELIAHPVAVDPDLQLKAYANSNNWPIVSLRNQDCPSHHFK